MLQQTQVATVLPYYREWLRRFPDFASLAAAPEADVLHAWQGLGYYARARNLHAAAKFVLTRHGGTFPTSTDEMRELPGLGRYTANAVATFAFDQPVPLVEANTARLLARLLNLQVNIDSSSGKEAIWSFAAHLLPRIDAITHNSAMMDLGALVCVSGPPRCSICPVRRYCLAKEPALLPLKRPRPTLKRITEYHRFALVEGRFLLEQSHRRWRGMWILPRVDARSEKGRLLHSAEFPFTHHRVTLAVHRGGTLLSARSSHRWFTRNELPFIPLPSPHRRALDQLLAAAPQTLCSTIPAI